MRNKIYGSILVLGTALLCGLGVHTLTSEVYSEDTPEVITVKPVEVKQNQYTIESTGMINVANAVSILEQQGYIEEYKVPASIIEAKRKKAEKERKRKEAIRQQQEERKRMIEEAKQRALANTGNVRKSEEKRIEQEATLEVDETLDNYPNAKYLGVFSVTAYCNCVKCCGKYSPEAGGKGTTKTGTYPKEGRTVAVDPHVIPLGSKIYMNGHVYIAEDIGSGIKGNDIDLFFTYHSQTGKWGRRNCKVWLLGK